LRSSSGLDLQGFIIGKAFRVQESVTSSNQSIQLPPQTKMECQRYVGTEQEDSTKLEGDYDQMQRCEKIRQADLAKVGPQDLQEAKQKRITRR
jgi:hypothetical protein